MITFEWQFPSLFVVLKQGALSNIVTQVDWVLEATHEKEKLASCSGTVSLGQVSKESFINFNQLTKENVLEWVLLSLGEDEVSKLKENLAAQAVEQLNFVSVSMSPPWLRRTA